MAADATQPQNMSPPLRAIGLMSGTSLDGVDAAVIETDGVSITGYGPAVTVSYDPGLRADLRRLLDSAPGLVKGAYDPFLHDVERRLTERHADAVKALGVRANLLGFHGQTILHRPQEGWTWQIGDAALLARLTGIDVVHDFRSADMQAGGQGAPLVPLFHRALAEGLPEAAWHGADYIAVLNIGGVSNVTLIGRDGTISASDTGPGNGPLDDWATLHTGQECDRDGALARSGRVDQAVLARLLAAPFFRLPPPKSLDRLDFSHSLTESGVHDLSAGDGAATLTAFTAASIAALRWPGREPGGWIIVGGGRRNPAIMEALQGRLAVPVYPGEAFGWDGDALEAQCFGYLAVRSVRGLPLSEPATTGVKTPISGGRLVRCSPVRPV
ncbi:anhydro-N-acetylmuramic acid kinase [Granulibacter bethesdensis]|uniref:Anhydro-N-acetylmuramic acid kinase n=1 Tax=Granulibacter bethesdensis (strain ATCC BAA-1260 / CGDNIH1) TaxID=391165 RepID=Q0BQQ8_GRABC|nr:anhydro-N-acetylmuramic acid kinase [Granulibacter bethesdensis]ABI62845.1 Hypothetical protein GbCGDNIH1_1947 [Granulibacter bethesdensis CGDNIH1]AHJ68202.1 Hypothetical protein GbCGDNIH2_1947 [Granulibacter bethesdensis]APH52711.1 Hypothetical protein GbCGDNIH5_1947 [Granulibacter bethesdensis]APH65399.1 Hypothetical protein GbCGDNIH1I4_1947 [Granulibacter bethesdensis]